MKHQTQKRKRGFSLVELMISLIAISLISAAFVPIITKKLSNGAITIGSFGNGGNSGDRETQICPEGYYQKGENSCGKCSDVLNNCTQCSSANRCTACANGYQIDPATNQCISTACAETEGEPSEACCAEFKAKYVELNGKKLCIMKYNLGDDENTFLVNGEEKTYNPEYVKYGVAINNVNDKYLSRYAKGKCWKGLTSSSGTIKATADSYSPRSRTVCDSTAAKIGCAIWAPNGSKVGAWRLLSLDEGNQLATIMTAETSTTENNIFKYAKDGLQLCTMYTRDYGMNICPRTSICISATSNNYCQPSAIVLDDNSTLSAADNKQGSGSIGTLSDTSKNYAFSVRCASENVFKALASNKAYNQGESEPVDEYEPRSQEDCDPYNALYINKKYLGTKNNICMLKYNAGDKIWDDGLPNGQNFYARIGVSMNKASDDYSSRYAPNGKCWRGDIDSNLYTAAGSGEYAYSPRARTVCTPAAGTAICKNWSYKATNPGDWRLLSEDEATGLVQKLKNDSFYSNFFSRYLNEKGLQLCTHRNTTKGGMNYCADTKNCISATDNYCKPGQTLIQNNKMIYDSNEDGYNNFAIYIYEAGSYGYSIRCVSNLIRGGHTPIADKTVDTVTNEPTEKDCEALGAFFIDKNVINNFLDRTTDDLFTRNICITRWNMADKTIAIGSQAYIGNNTDEDYANVGIRMVDVSNTSDKCPDKTPCCWRGGDTSVGGGTYTYNAKTRTVCNYSAAELMCKNWRPDGKGRLLTEAEAVAIAKALKTDSIYSTYLSRFMNNGLQFCHQLKNSKYGMNYCPDSSVCMGATDNACHTGYIITEGSKCIYDIHKSQHSDSSGGGWHDNPNSEFAVNGCKDTIGYSVRCVYDGLTYN